MQQHATMAAELPVAVADAPSADAAAPGGVVVGSLRGEVLVVGPLQVFSEHNVAMAAGRTLMLSVREFRMLRELVRCANRIMTRDELYKLVWGHDMRTGDRSVDVYIRKLRVKLERVAPDWRFIHTHFGFGYRLSAEPLITSR